MASVTAYSAARMKEIEDTTVVSGLVDVDGHLLLTTREGTEIDAGLVMGPPGEDGGPGEPGIAGSSVLPAGTISMWTGDTAPSNWMLCDGSAVSRTDYATLFASIGTKYGVGDGVNTFNLPNLKGRVPVGQDSAQTEFDTLGETGGEKTHVLTTAEMPSHTHIQNAHSHTVNNATGGNTSSLGFRASSYLNSGTGTTVGDFPSGSTTATNQTEGGGGSHNNLQPYHVVNFIIKTTSGETPEDSGLTTRVSALETGGSLPAGTVSMFSGETPPSNWLLCDGAAVSRTTYASLYSAIGTKYGIGDGFTTFNLPNLKGRVPIGLDPAQTEFDNLGEVGGSKSHLHTLSDAGIARIAMAARSTHQIIMRRIAGASYAPTHSINNANLGGGAGNYSTTEGVGAGLAGDTDSATALPPYQVVNFIIKTTSGVQANDSQLAQRVSVLESNLPIELAGGIDLNTITDSGFYTQSQNADAVSGSNYPVPYAGVLEVITNPSGNMSWQKYRPYHASNYNTRHYERAYYSSTGWSAWEEYKSVSALNPAWIDAPLVSPYQSYGVIVPTATSTLCRYRVVDGVGECLSGWYGRTTSTVALTAGTAYTGPFTIPDGSRPDEGIMAEGSIAMAGAPGKLQFRINPDGSTLMIPGISGTFTAMASNCYLAVPGMRWAVAA